MEIGLGLSTAHDPVKAKLFDVIPVTYASRDDTQELPNHRKDTEDTLKPKRDDIPLQHSDSFGNGGTRVVIDAPRDESGPACPTRFASPHAIPAESSIAAPKASVTAAEKRSASDSPIDDHVPKRLRADHVSPIINTTTVARVPASLTEYRQE